MRSNDYFTAKLCEDVSEWLEDELGIERTSEITGMATTIHTEIKEQPLTNENAKDDDLTQKNGVLDSLHILHSYNSEDDVPHNIPNVNTISRGELLGWDCTSYFDTNQVFNTREEVTAWCKSVGRTCGVVVGIKKSDNPKHGRRGRISYWCERSGPYQKKKGKKELGKPVKRTGTKKCGCPFLLKGVKLPDDDQWQIKVVCGMHNHPVDENTTFEGHSYVGRLSKSEERVVADMSICGVKPKEILRVIKQGDPHNASTIETIYNYRSKHRIAEKQGRTQMQQLLHILDEKGYEEFHRKNEITDEVEDLFFSHPYSITLVKCFPHILLMDCTYKTNRHDMPLLEIVGVTSTGKTFIVAQAYLRSEKDDNYSWALQCVNEILPPDIQPSVILTDRELGLIKAITIVFPNTTHLLCTWHICKNIQTHGKVTFETNADWELFIQYFNVVIKEPTEESFYEALRELKVKYATCSKILKYIDEIWLLPYKERFAAAWTNRVMHFGNLTTNRVESQHSSLKKYLGNSRGDLVSNLVHIDNLLISQHVAIRASFRRSLHRRQNELHVDEFRCLTGFISHLALDLLLEERERVQYIGIDVSKCGCLLRQTHGLPCAHEIVQFNREGRCIPLSSIHPFWRKLNDIPGQPQNVSIDCELKISLFRQRFDQASEERKCMMLKQLREISNPATTTMAPPLKNKFPKGRPNTKKRKRINKSKQDSTKRDPSGFEYAKSREELLSQQSVVKPNSVSKYTRKQKVKTCIPDLTENEEFDLILHEFNQQIRDHVILSLGNVPPDGHCGYRCCAEMLGLSIDHGWKKVRGDMLLELHVHKELYLGILGGEETYRKVEYALNYYGTFAKRKCWMQFPDMGCLFATAFNCILVVLSPEQCITYLPLRFGPTSEVSKIVSILLVEGNHFVKVSLKQASPIPPIVPGWEYNCYPDAYIWLRTIQLRLQKWHTLMMDSSRELPSIQKHLNDDYLFID